MSSPLGCVDQESEVDGYSKILLTVIALATVAIAWQSYVRDHTYSGACGAPKIPCFVSTASGTWLAVRIIDPNQPAP